MSQESLRVICLASVLEDNRSMNTSGGGRVHKEVMPLHKEQDDGQKGVPQGSMPRPMALRKVRARPDKVGED